MDQQRVNRITSLVRSCEELSPSERAHLLDHACLGDDELRQEVELHLEQGSAKTKAYIHSNDLEKALPSYYKLIKLIGTGGMAEVYLAEDSRLNRLVAIKFLNEAFRRDAERMRRFSHEARSASALNHPNIITIYDIGENEGLQFIVTEYVEGETLGSRIKRDPIPIPETIDIVIQIASALHEAHQAGIIHRDLKPDNLMLRRDGSVKVLDFGLAKGSINSLAQAVDLEGRTMEALNTSPGLILGTPQYMSPEQTRALTLDGRTDIFSLGCVMFEMLTGKMAFNGESTIDVIAAIIGKESLPLRDHMADPPAELVRIIDKALRKDRDQRYLTMEHLLSDLRDLKHELIFESTSENATRRARAPETLNESMPSKFGGTRKWMVSLPVLAVVIFSAWWFYDGFGKSESASGGQMRSVAIISWNSSSGESVAAAAFSPDSKMVAYASTRSGSTELWVKPTVGGDPIQVTKNGFYNQYPVWSPNGQELAFFSKRSNNNGIWRVAFTGGQELQIVSGIDSSAQPLYWSDGKIIFQDKLEIFAIDESSGERRQLTDFSALGIRPRTVAVSRDGTTLAISLQDGDVWKIKTKRFNADQFVEVTTSKGQVEEIAFHPNGTSIFYSASVDGTFQILRADGINSAPVQISNGNSDLVVQDVSTDGSRILSGSVVETSDLWAVDSQTLNELPVANDVPLEYWADISPDGKIVVFQSVTQPDRPFRGSIVSKSLASSDSPTLVSPDGILPTWSHDGQSIAFIRRTDTGFGLWKIRPTGADAVKLVDGSVASFSYLGTPYLKKGTSHISWSPDDQSIAYSRTIENISNIWITTADGSQNYVLTSNKDSNEVYSSPVWMPDGRSIAFISERTAANVGTKTYRLWSSQLGNVGPRLNYESNESFMFLGLTSDSKEAVMAVKADATDVSPTPSSIDIYSLSLQSGAKKPITTTTSAYYYNIHLSRDGRNIAFVTRRNNISEVWTVPVSGGTPRKIISEKDPKVLFSSLVWSPDNRSLILGKQTRTNLLSMLTN